MNAHVFRRRYLKSTLAITASILFVGNRAAGVCGVDCPDPPCEEWRAGDPIEYTTTATEDCLVRVGQNPSGSESWDAAAWASHLGFEVLTATDPTDLLKEYEYTQGPPPFCFCALYPPPFGGLGTSVTDSGGIVIEWAASTGFPDLTSNGVYTLTAIVRNNFAYDVPCANTSGLTRDSWYYEEEHVDFTLNVVGTNGCCDAGTSGVPPCCIAPDEPCCGSSPDCCGSPDCNSNGILDSCEIDGLIAEDANTNGIPDDCEAVLYVDTDATGANDGSNWQNAFVYLQDALAAAAAPGSVVSEIWVAEGTYYPDQGTGQILDNRNASFQLVSGVAIFGGFIGNENSLLDRYPSSYGTLLSGDIGLPGDATDNSYHVVTIENASVLTKLDGFTISDGYADGSGAGSYPGAGGGILAIDSSPILARCMFVQNTALIGGAIASFGPGELSCVSSVFHYNHALDAGGALATSQTSLQFHNSSVYQCSAVNAGGAVYAFDADVAIGAATLYDNLVTDPAGMGGGVRHVTAGSSDLSATNTILWANSDSAGEESNSQLSLGSSVTASVEYSCVHGGWTGTGNFSLDPQIRLTMLGETVLSPSSPCIGAGAATMLPSDVADLDGDGDTFASVPFDVFDSPRLKEPAILDVGSHQESANLLTDCIAEPCPEPLYCCSDTCIDVICCGDVDCAAGETCCRHSGQDRCCAATEVCCGSGCVPIADACQTGTCTEGTVPPSGVSPHRDHMGTEFLVAWPFPNTQYPSATESPPGYCDFDDMQTPKLLLTADACTVVSVRYPARGAPEFEHRVVVLPGRVTEVELDLDILRRLSPGVNENSALLVSSLFTAEIGCIVAAAHGSCVDPIRGQLGAAFLALPTNSVGTDYFILTGEPDDAPVSETCLERNDHSVYRRGLFSVVATEPNTLLTVYPKAELAGDECQGIVDAPCPITLDEKGDVFVAMPEDIGGNGNLIGTRIEANKPVVVASGNRHDREPTEWRAEDTVAEVALPVSSWGTEFYIAQAAYAPHAVGCGQPLCAGPASYYILAAQDGTVVHYDGEGHALDAGEYLTIREHDDVAGMRVIYSTGGGIAIWQFSLGHCGLRSSSWDLTGGGPSAAMIPAVTHFQQRHTFGALSSISQIEFPWAVVGITADARDIANSTITLNGSQIASTDFTLFPDGRYGVATIPIDVGTSYVTMSIFPHSAVVSAHNEWGAGYMYPAGFFLEPATDEIPPVASCACMEDGGSTCSASDMQTEDENGTGVFDEGDVIIMDNGLLDIDTGVADVSEGVPWQNLSLAVDTFSPGDPTVNFTVSRVVETADAYGVIVVTDMAGNTTEYEIAPPLADIAFESWAETGPPWYPLPEEGSLPYVDECEPFVITARASAANSQHVSTGLRYAWDLDGSNGVVLDPPEAQSDDVVVSKRSVGGESPCGLGAGECTDIEVSVRVTDDEGRCDVVSAFVAVRDLEPTAAQITGPRSRLIGQQGLFAVMANSPCDPIDFDATEWDCEPLIDEDSDGDPFEAEPNTGREHTCTWDAAGTEYVEARVVDSDGDVLPVQLEVMVVDGGTEFDQDTGNLRVEAAYHTYVLAGSGTDWIHRTELTVTNDGIDDVVLPIWVVFETVSPTTAVLVGHALGTEGPAAGKWFLEFDMAGTDLLFPGESVTVPMEWQVPASWGDEFTYTVTAYAKQSRPRFIASPLDIAVEGELYEVTLLAEDADGDPVFYELAATPVPPDGMTLMSDTGILSWTPSETAAAPASGGPLYDVTIRALDGHPGSYAELHLTIEVLPFNVEPRITSTPETSVAVGDTYSYILTATDDDGDSLEFVPLSIPEGAAFYDETHAQDPGLLTWQPTELDAGLHWVTLEVRDDGSPPLATSLVFPLSVVPCIPAPQVLNPIDQDTAEEGLAYSRQVVATIDGVPPVDLYYFLEEAPAGMSITDEGLIFWQPSYLDAGLWQIDVLVTIDPAGFGDCIATDRYTLDVAERNTTPTIWQIPPQIAAEGEPFTYEVMVHDIDGDPHTFQLIGAPEGMQIDRRLGTITWTPSQTAAEDSPYNITVVATDSQGAFAEATFTLTVKAVNVPPIIRSRAPRYATAKVPGHINYVGYEYLIDAEDVDGDALITPYELLNPSDPTMQLNGTVVYWEPTLAAIDLNPHSFTVKVCEDKPQDAECTERTYSVVVATGYIGNDLPVVRMANPRWYHAIVGEPYAQDFVVTDEDQETGGDFTCSVSISPDPGGASAPTVPATTTSNVIPLTWTPEPGQESTTDPYVVTVTVADNHQNETAFSYPLWVYPDSPNNQPPIIVSEPVTTLTFGSGVAGTGGGPTAAYRYKVIAVDPDSPSLTFSLEYSHVNDDPAMPLVPPPAGMQISNDPGVDFGLISWDYSAAALGVYWVTVKVTDGALEDTQTFSINSSWIAGNRAPNITSDPATLGLLNAQANVLYSYDVNAEDLDANDILEFSLRRAPAGASIEADTGLIQWVPTEMQVDSHEFVVRVTDTGLEYDEQEFVVSVTSDGANRPPSIESDPVLVAASDGSVVYSYPILVSDPDSGDTTTFSLEVAPSGMTVSASGEITWDPIAGEDDGTHLVRVRATDSASAYDEQSYLLTVSPTGSNHAPTITSIPPSTAIAGEPLEYLLIAYDEDGDTVTFEEFRKPSGAAFDTVVPSLFKWTPSKAQIGTQHIVLRATDGNGGWAEQDFSVAVSSSIVNHAPRIVSTPITRAAQDSQYIYPVFVEDEDFGDTAEIEVLEGPVQVDLTDLDPTDGTDIVWQVPASAGTHEVRIRATDALSATAEQSFTITVSPLGDNRSPRIVSAPVTRADSSGSLTYSYPVEAVDPDGDPLTWVSFGTGDAPDNMLIDAAGNITWNPVSAAGTYPVIVEVHDGRGGVAYQEYTVTASAGATNDPPLIITEPITRLIEGREYVYPIEWKVDPDTPFSHTVDPSGADRWFSATAQPDTSVDLHWNAAGYSPGPYPLTLTITDSLAAWSAQDYTIDVVANAAPSIESFSPPLAIVGKTYRYEVVVEDADDDAEDLTYQLVDNPVGAPDFDWETTGSNVLVWSPTVGDIRTEPYEFTIEVTDPSGATAQQTFRVRVVDLVDADAHAPELQVAEPQSPVPTDAPTEVIITATDDLGLQSIDYTIYKPDGTADLTNSVSVGGAASWSDSVSYSVPSSTGVYRVEVVATDEAIRTTTVKTAFFTTGIADPDSYPDVAITSPDDSVLDGDEYEQATISERTVLFGWVVDANLLRYALEYRLVGAGDDAWVEMPFPAEAMIPGTVYNAHAPVGDVDTPAPLGEIDPTVMVNGLYDVRLTAEDTTGKMSQFVRTYAVTGDVKIGNFTMTFTDLSVPVSGIPLTVMRTYDSRAKWDGDFGVGWKLAFSSLALQENDSMGEAWVQGAGGFWGLDCEALPARSHSVTMTWPDGRTEVFELDVEVRPYRIGIGDSCDVTEVDGVSLRRVSNGTSTLRIIGSLPESWDPLTGVVGIGDTSYSVTVWEPDGYELTTADGTVYTFERSSSDARGVIALSKVTDENNNTIEFSADGVFHSAGPSVSWVRDDNNRIRKLFDPDGNVIEYIYDGEGDLVEVIDRERNSTRFVYDDDHKIVDILDPRGVKVARNIYDDNSRLIGHIDAEGYRIDYFHCTDLEAGSRPAECAADNWELVSDRLGNMTAYAYDDRGNVTRKKQWVTTASGPEEYITDYAYDDRNNLTETIVDPDPDVTGDELTTEQGYDAFDNLKWQTDAYGNRTDYSYDDRNRLTRTVDPLSRSTENEYDNSGNLTRVTQRGPGGLPRSTEYTYDAQGNQESHLNPAGHLTTSEFDGRGNLTRQVDAEGDSSEYFYDASGRRTRELRPGANGSPTIEYTYDYDLNGRLTWQEGPLGQFTETIYNEIGKQEEVITQSGSTRYDYDIRGNLERVTYDDGSYEEYKYDAAGRRTQTRNRDGKISSVEYDAAGRVTKSSMPDITDVDGAPQTGTNTQKAYDGAGRVTGRTDAGGNTTTYAYGGDMFDGNDDVADDDVLDGESWQEVTTPLVTIHTDTPTYADYATRSVHDRSGNLARVRDARNNLVEYEYDHSGQRTKTIFTHDDGSKSYVKTEYDDAGRKIAEIDQDQKRTEFGYDNVGRLIKVTDALNQITEYTYDGAGNRTRQIDARQRETDLEYDDLNRLTRRVLPQQGQDPRLEEVFVYDSAGSMTQHTAFDGSPTLYAYDLNSRLETKTLPFASFATFVDGSEESTPIGAHAAFTLHGSLDQLDVICTHDVPSPVTIQIESADRSSIVLPLANSISGVFNTLDISSALTELLAGDLYIAVVKSGYGSGAGYIRSKIVAVSPVVEYNYQAGGLRTQTGAATYDYDARGQLMAETKATGEIVEYKYDEAGNRTLVRIRPGESQSPSSVTSYAYDELNRLVTVTDDPDAADPESRTTTYTYDEVGNLSTVAYGNGTGAAYEYDALNRLTRIVNTFADGAGGQTVKEYVYKIGPAGNRLQVDEYSYAPGSPPTYDGDSARTVQYGYDDTYRLTREVVSTSLGWQSTIEYTYDAVGNRETMVVDDIATLARVETTYEYDAMDRLTSHSETTTALAAADPRIGDRYAGVLLPRRSAGTAVAVFASVAMTCLLAPFALLRCRGSGRRARRNRRFIAAVAAFFVPLFAVHPEALANLHLEAMLFRAGAAAAVATPEVTTYTYDLNGNMTSRTDASASITYAYDAENRLVLVNQGFGPSAIVSYTYDADGIRTSKRVGAKLTRYTTDKNRPYAQVLEERLDGGISGATELTRYVYGHDLICQLTPSHVYPDPDVRYFHYDGQMSTRHLSRGDTNEGTLGFITDSFDFDAFGVRRGPQVPEVATSYLYTGEQYDEDAAIYYLRARYYDQSVGRFITRDGYAGSTWDPVTLHKYLYAAADPFNKIDPSGNDFTIAGFLTTMVIALALYWNLGLLNALTPSSNSGTGTGGKKLDENRLLNLRSQLIRKYATGPPALRAHLDATTFSHLHPIKGATNWEIHELFVYDPDETQDDKFATASSVPWTVTVGSYAYWQSEVNYWLYGAMARAMDEFDGESRLERAKMFVYEYRAVRAQGEGATGRVAWTEAGYYGNTDLATGSFINGMSPSNVSYDGGLWAYWGTISDVNLSIRVWD